MLYYYTVTCLACTSCHLLQAPSSQPTINSLSSLLSPLSLSSRKERTTEGGKKERTTKKANQPISLPPYFALQSSTLVPSPPYLSQFPSNKNPFKHQLPPPTLSIFSLSLSLCFAITLFPIKQTSQKGQCHPPSRPQSFGPETHTNGNGGVTTNLTPALSGSPLGTMANMDNSNQETWVPYETTKDCSLGFCSIYCPQWCYIIFPPPPPTFFEDGSSGTTFSPLVIAIIGILASAFLLVSYYTIISKYCGRLEALRRRQIQHSPADDEIDDNDAGNSRRHEGWHASPSTGLDEVLINKIAVCRYKRGDGLVDGTDCSVCLSEFREDESLRLLPKCSHAFHVQCIDTWLKSHTNCPLCRANVISMTPAPPQLPAPPVLMENNSPEVEVEHNDEMVIAMVAEESSNREGEVETELGSDHGDLLLQENCDQGGSEVGHCTVEIGDDGMQPIRRSLSLGSSQRCRVSIADVLRMSLEDEFLVAKEHGLLSGGGGSAGSSRRCGGEHSKSGSSGGRSRGLHCVMSPVPMKRSVSSGRFCFTRNGRGRSSVLPL